MSRKKQAMIIGLGQFGRALARTLASRGVEVLAIDQSEAAVELVADVVDDCLVLDASIESALVHLEPRRRDLCVCAIGSETRDSAIIVIPSYRAHGLIGDQDRIPMRSSIVYRLGVVAITDRP